MKEKTRVRTRRYIFPLIIVVITTVLAIGIVEGAFRWILGPDYAPTIYSPDINLGKKYIPGIESMQVGFTAFEGVKEPISNRYKVRINSMGFRGPEVTGEDRKKFRVVSLGDSCTFGYGEEEEFIYTAVLEKILSQKRSTRVYNLGVTDFTSYQGLLWFREIADVLKPDVVTIAFCHNDGRDIIERGPLWTLPMKPDKEILGKGDEYGVEGKIKFYWMKYFILTFKNSATMSWVTRKLKTKILFAAPGAAPAKAGAQRVNIQRVSLPDFAENLKHLIAEARKRGAKPILITICYRDEYVNMAIEVAREQNVPIITSKELFQSDPGQLRLNPEYAKLLESVEARFGADNIVRLGGKLYFTNDFLHPNPVGHRLIAEALAREMENPDNR